MIDILVPSADIKPVNELAGTLTLARVKNGVRIWDPCIHRYMVCTGDICHPPHIQTCPAAQLMTQKALEMPNHPPPTHLMNVSSFDTYGDVVGYLMCTFSRSRAINYPPLSRWCWNRDYQSMVEKIRGYTDYDTTVMGKVVGTVIIPTYRLHGLRFKIIFKRAWGVIDVQIEPTDGKPSLKEYLMVAECIRDPYGLGRLNRYIRSTRSCYYKKVSQTDPR